MNNRKIAATLTVIGFALAAYGVIKQWPKFLAAIETLLD